MMVTAAVIANSVAVITEDLPWLSYMALEQRRQIDLNPCTRIQSQLADTAERDGVTAARCLGASASMMGHGWPVGV